VVAERVFVGRPLRRTGTSELLGNVRGRPQVVTTPDGVELYAEVDPAGRGGRWPDLTVVLVHGYALNLDSFHFQRTMLRGQVRVVAYDARSHGRSGRGPNGSATIDQLGVDLACVLDALAPGPVVVVAHSMGGMTVMALAEQHPEYFGDRIVGVALLSTSSGKLAQVTLGVPALAARVMRRVAPGVVATLGKGTTLVERGRRMGSDLSLVLTRVYSFGGDVPSELVDFVAGMIASTPIDVIAEFFPAFAAHDKFHALEALANVETLVVVGEQDLLTPSDHSRAIVAELPGAELLVLDPGGHMALIERADEVNAALIELLDRVVRAKAER
jgi:pimeloyl-ACP methyl ester carboxylesterase